MFTPNISPGATNPNNVSILEYMKGTFVSTEQTKVFREGQHECKQKVKVAHCCKIHQIGQIN